MKTINIIPFMLAVIAVLASMIARANDKYVTTMQKHIDQVYSAKSADEIQSAVNAMERIGEVEKNKWEPFYYAAFGQIMLATREQDAVKKDAYLDQALKNTLKAAVVKPNDSEITALEGFVHMIRVTVDPASRGQQYSGLAFQSFSKAVAIDPNNPRALFMLAQMQYGTAQFFGSSTAEACSTLNKALEKFDVYSSDNSLAPKWGKSMAESMRTNCR
jgi:tetratricopeptide (TPR) repeat protein